MTVRQREKNKQKRSKYHLEKHIRLIDKSGRALHVPATRIQGHKGSAAARVGDLVQSANRMFRDRRNRTEEQRQRDHEEDSHSAVDVGIERMEEDNDEGMLLHSNKQTNNQTRNRGHGGRLKFKRKRAHIHSKIFRKKIKIFILNLFFYVLNKMCDEQPSDNSLCDSIANMEFNSGSN